MQVAKRAAVARQGGRCKWQNQHCQRQTHEDDGLRALEWLAPRELLERAEASFLRPALAAQTAPVVKGAALEPEPLLPLVRRARGVVAIGKMEMSGQVARPAVQASSSRTLP